MNRKFVLFGNKLCAQQRTVQTVVLWSFPPTLTERPNHRVSDLRIKLANDSISHLLAEKWPKFRAWFSPTLRAGDLYYTDLLGSAGGSL